jgi:hypothetical protein
MEAIRPVAVESSDEEEYVIKPKIEVKLDGPAPLTLDEEMAKLLK